MNQVVQFYHLGGHTIGEHKRNFNFFLRSLSIFSTSEVIDIIKQLKPRYHQEELFYLKLLLKYEQYDLVLIILFNENRIINKLIIRDRNFCKYVVNNISADDFVGNICPNTSYITRIHLIQNMVWAFEEPADSYFYAIREAYGTNEALLILPACTRPLIESILKETKCRLKQKHLIYLHKKFPGIIKFYCENCKHIISEYKDLCIYILCNAPEHLQYIPCMSKKKFYKYFAIKEKQIIENPTNYMNYLTLIKKEMKKKGQSFDVILKNVFPKDCKHFEISNSILSVLNLYPKNLRATKFLDTYKELYGETYTDLVETSLLDIIDVNDWESFQKDDSYIEYNPLEISIPIIQNHIEISKMEERIYLLQKLIKTCKLHDSEEALLDVLRFFCGRHRCETVETRNALMNEILDNFNIETLSDEHWLYLSEILLVFKMYNEKFKNHFKYLEIIILRHMKNNRNYMYEYKEYLKITQSCSWSVIHNYPEYHKQLILSYPRTWINVNPYDYEAQQLKFLLEVSNFNKKNKNIFINPHDFTELIQLTYKNLKSGHSCFAYLCIDVIFKYAKDFNEKVKICNNVIPVCKHYSSHIIYFWALKYKPDLIILHLDAILNNYSNSKFYYEINKMHFTKLRQMVINRATTMFNTRVVSHVLNAIPMLSYKLNYLDLIKNYPPEVNSDTKPSKFHTFNRKILISLKCAINPAESFETLYKFWFKEYLLDVLNILYFSCYHCQSSLLEEKLFRLYQTSPKARKQALVLIVKLAKLSTKLSILSSIAQTEMYLPNRKYIFNNLFELFLTNQTEATFNALTENFELYNVNDSKRLKKILIINDISTRFKSNYIAKLWEHLAQKKLDLENDLLCYIDYDIIKNLPIKLGLEIFNLTMFEYKGEDQSFVYNYLKIYQKNLDILWDLINEHIKVPYITNLGLAKALSILNSRFDNIILNAIKCEEEASNKMLCCNLLAGFNNIHSSICLSHIQLKLDLCNHYVQFGTHAFKSYLILKQTEFLGSELLEMYWESAESVFSKIIKCCHSSIDKWDFHMKFLEEMLTLDKSSDAKMLVLYLMPNPQREDTAELNRINNMLEIIKQDMNTLLEVYYNRYISQ